MPGGTRVLRIGTVVTAARFTAVLTDRFTARNPHVPVHIVTLPPAEIGRQLEDADLDAGLLYADCPWSSGMRIELFAERLQLLTPVQSQLGRRASTVSVASAVRRPLVALSPDVQSPTILDGIVAAARGLYQPQILCDSLDSLHTHLRTVHWSAIVAMSWLHGVGIPAGMRAIPLTDDLPCPPVVLQISDRADEWLLSVLATAAREIDVV
jgi:DNA-binding transcriptional LysR family regulator